ncbi:MAG TPA: hypothetical protein VMY76_10435 [Gemmatimonadales bacterium]|nr:hypothetical protein [Gemmatimonadales bacterium]
MPRRTLALAAALASVSLVAACSDPAVCLPNVVPAVEIEVRDASTDEFIAGIVRGVLSEGAFVDSLRVIASIGNDPAVATTLGAGEERPGTYAVHLEGSGYAAWDTGNVRVTRDECHVRTATFTARLSPLPE